MSGAIKVDVIPAPHLHPGSSALVRRHPELLVRLGDRSKLSKAFGRFARERGYGVVVMSEDGSRLIEPSSRTSTLKLVDVAGDLGQSQKIYETRRKTQ